jgi:hypothetical protein
VGPDEGSLNFYVMEDSTLSSFSKSEIDSLIENGKKLRDVVKVQISRIDNIIKNYCNEKFPDFLSIDVEGMDFEILRTIDFNKYSPKVICVEAAEYSPTGAGRRKNELINYLVAKGYFEYANTNLNAIMVKKEFWFI